MCVTQMGPTRSARYLKDHTMRLWNLMTGAETCHLEGHSYQMGDRAVRVTDGRFTSGSGDSTIRLCHPMIGAETAYLQGTQMRSPRFPMLTDGSPQPPPATRRTSRPAPA
jgi:hypothetical protein